MRFLILAGLVLAAQLSGCASALRPERAAQVASAASAPPATAPVGLTASNAQGPVSARRVVAQVAAEGRPGLARRHLERIAAQRGAHLYSDNAARLLIDGPQTFAAMRAALHAARSRVLLESYIFDDEGVAAEMGSLLVERARAGVGVAVLYDSLGSRASSDSFFDGLRAGGVAVCAFNPVNPLRRPGYWGISQRDHRKFLIVDDQVGFTGGINISQVYAAGSSGPARRRAVSPQAAPEGGWRDTHVELRGPVVPALAAAYEAQWHTQGCRDALPAAPSGAPRAAGATTVQLLLSDPEDEHNPIYEALLGAIESAQRSVHLTMAYFAPGKRMAEALAGAARRGVEVVLILPSRSDFDLVLYAGRAYYGELLAAGVRIHELQSALLHAKTAVIDGVWSTVGSSNMDWRSWVDNSEANAVVLGDDFGRALEAQFALDLADARPVQPQDWARRGPAERVMELIGRLAERQF
ncbi:MAG: cardiolipin synthase B [Piscinibacter sp.]|nr:cardiolipin synthase B [Piscinibacter sp.]